MLSPYDLITPDSCTTHQKLLEKDVPNILRILLSEKCQYLPCDLQMAALAIALLDPALLQGRNKLIRLLEAIMHDVTTGGPDFASSKHKKPVVIDQVIRLPLSISDSSYSTQTRKSKNCFPCALQFGNKGQSRRTQQQLSFPPFIWYLSWKSSGVLGRGPPRCPSFLLTLRVLCCSVNLGCHWGRTNNSSTNRTHDKAHAITFIHRLMHFNVLVFST